MGKKNRDLSNPIQERDERDIFLDRVLQWLCELQTREIELFDEKRVSEIAQLITKKLNLVVFCDFDTNYRTAMNLRVLIDEKGKSPSIKSDNFYDSTRVSQFEFRIDISGKGGFFCIRINSVVVDDGRIFSEAAREKPKAVLQVQNQLVQLLTKHGLIYVPEQLLHQNTSGKNILGDDVTVLTQLFGED